MNNLVVIPASPALVEELAPGDVPSRVLADAARAALAPAIQAGLPVEIVGSRAKRWYTARTGSFGAWGAPQVEVDGGNYLPELVARYLLSTLEAPAESTRPAEPYVASSREKLGPIDPDALTLVAIDGSAGLTSRAPLALLDGAQEAHRWCEKILAGQRSQAIPSPHELRAAGIIEPEIWVELATLRPRSAALVASDATLGVGRYVAEWSA